MQRMFSNKALRQLIVPLVIEQALAVLVGMMDTMMVASVSEAAMSGVSLVDQINNVIICLLAALATGGAVVSSQLLGAKDQKKACESANQLMLVVLAVSLGIMALSVAFCRPLLSMVYGSIEADVMDAAVTYLWITALSFPFLAVYNGAAALYRSMGKSRSTMYVSMLMNAINVAGNALLVYVFKLGVAGVAIPTLVSRAVAAGTGLAGCHGGLCDAFRQDTDWQFMTGGQWVAHPGNDGTRYTVNVRRGSSPIVEGLEDFEVCSEQYYLHVDPAIEVLATTRFPVAAGPHCANKPVDMPVVWTKYWGCGRVFYNSLGHHDDVFDKSPEAAVLMERGLVWAAEGRQYAAQHHLTPEKYGL